MIRLHSGCAGSALDHVQAVHVAVGIAAARKIADVFHVAGESAVQEVGVERDNDVGLGEVIARLEELSESNLSAKEIVFAFDMFLDVPLRLRIELQEVAQLIGQGGRGDGRRENANP